MKNWKASMLLLFSGFAGQIWSFPFDRKTDIKNNNGSIVRGSAQKSFQSPHSTHIVSHPSLGQVHINVNVNVNVCETQVNIAHKVEVKLQDHRQSPVYDSQKDLTPIHPPGHHHCQCPIGRSSKDHIPGDLSKNHRQSQVKYDLHRQFNMNGPSKKVAQVQRTSKVSNPCSMPARVRPGKGQRRPPLEISTRNRQSCIDSVHLEASDNHRKTSNCKPNPESSDQVFREESESKIENIGQTITNDMTTEVLNYITTEESTITETDTKPIGQPTTTMEEPTSPEYDIVLTEEQTSSTEKPTITTQMTSTTESIIESFEPTISTTTKEMTQRVSPTTDSSTSISTTLSQAITDWRDETETNTYLIIDAEH